MMSRLLSVPARGGSLFCYGARVALTGTGILETDD
jgi:hypothetical protein